MKMASFFVTMLLLIFSLLSDAFCANPLDPSPLPFWRSKTHIFRTIADERAIVVSVKTEKKSAELSNLRMQGGGLVKMAPLLTFQNVQKYEKLKQVSDYFREVHYNTQKKELYIRTEAFKYEARMTMKVSTDESSPHERRLNFKVVEGSFIGMEGSFRFEDFKSNSTVMGFEANYPYKKLPMPQFFVEFGLEVILQKVAGRMRSFLEKESGL